MNLYHLTNTIHNLDSLLIKLGSTVQENDKLVIMVDLLPYIELLTTGLLNILSKRYTDNTPKSLEYYVLETDIAELAELPKNKVLNYIATANISINIISDEQWLQISSDCNSAIAL